MSIEDQIPETFRRAAFHPSSFVYAWRRKDLEKLFDELLKSNIAILRGEVWLEEDGKTVSLIPLKAGGIDVFNLENIQNLQEEWFDFVERSLKDSSELINYWDLEKNVQPNLAHDIWYHFTFAKK